MEAQIKFLAKHSDVHHITVCDQNLIHLNFEHATLHLYPWELMDLASFLQYAPPHLERRNVYGNEDHFVMICTNGTYVAWLMGLGIQLNYSDFFALTQLVKAAAERLAPQIQSLQERIIFIPNTFSVSQVLRDKKTLLYINWVQITLRVKQTQFLKLAPFLNKARNRLQTRNCYGDDYHFIERDDQNNYQVWLDNHGFYFCEAEFRTFIDMARKTDRQLRAENDQKLSRLFHHARPYTFSDN